MKTEALFNPVYKIPAVEILPKGMVTNPQKSFAVVTEVEGKRILLNLCSEGYQLVPNETLIHSITPMIEHAGFKFEMTSRVFDHSKFFIDFILDNSMELRLKSGRTEILKPRIRLVNSYDGTIKYKAEAGIWRQICSNGLTVMVLGSSKRKRHTKQLEGDKSIILALEVISSILEDSDEFFDGYYELMDHRVSNPDLRVEEVLEAVKFPKTLADQVLERVEVERKMLNMSVYNDWLIYNGFNFHLSHNYEDSALKDHKREVIDEAIFTFLLEN